MGSDRYCLKWNYHWANLIGVFNSLLETETFVDVTISCEGHRLKAHRLVLSACSPYFTQLLVDNPDRHPVIILKGVSYVHLKAIIHFIYNGEVAVDQKELPVLISIARELQIRGLADKRLQEAQLQVAASQSLSKSISRDSAFGDDVKSAEEESVSPNGTALPGPLGALKGFSCSIMSGNEKCDEISGEENVNPEQLSMTSLDQPTDLTSNSNREARDASPVSAMPPPSPLATASSAPASVSPRSPRRTGSDSTSPTRKKRRLSDGDSEYHNGSVTRESDVSTAEEPSRRNGDASYARGPMECYDVSCSSKLLLFVELHIS